MTTDTATLAKIADIIWSQLPKYLPNDFIINEVKAENLPGPDDEDYVHVVVILEDDHPQLDPRKTLEFSSDMRALFEEAGIVHSPNISYANRSELST